MATAKMATEKYSFDPALMDIRENVLYRSHKVSSINCVIHKIVHAFRLINKWLTFTGGTGDGDHISQVKTVAELIGKNKPKRGKNRDKDALYEWDLLTGLRMRKTGASHKPEASKMLASKKPVPNIPQLKLYCSSAPTADTKSTSTPSAPPSITKSASVHSARLALSNHASFSKGVKLHPLSLSKSAHLSLPVVKSSHPNVPVSQEELDGEVVLHPKDRHSQARWHIDTESTCVVDIVEQVGESQAEYINMKTDMVKSETELKTQLAFQKLLKLHAQILILMFPQGWIQLKERYQVVRCHNPKVGP
ncbi:hypothetical protein FRC06_006548 [Ceratobasidium sp. 370]|nr:hypothetical protein FRC06_006548 [Ceratobasidium sp. 370]